MGPRLRAELYPCRGPDRGPCLGPDLGPARGPDRGPDLGPDLGPDFGSGRGSGLGSGLVAALPAPPIVVAAVTSLALLGTLAAAVTAALGEQSWREAAVVTLAVTVSGATPLGVKAAFRGLPANGRILLLHGRGAVHGPTPEPPNSALIPRC